MGVLEFTSLRAAWGGEAVAFTPLLSERLPHLGEACGLGDLELVDTELRTGNRRIDVMASTDERKIVIENQYGAADHDHLTRGLAYAVAEGASALVVVAERHGEEFRAVADYLNEVAAEASGTSVSVWLVEVRAARRHGDDIWSPLLTVVARPNTWEQAVKAASKAHGLTTMDAVLEAHPHATVARWLTQTWLQEEHATVKVGGKAAATLQLRHPDPVLPTIGHAFLTINPQRFWVNVGYLTESTGAFGGAGKQAELDAQLATAFPDARARHGQLPGYLTIEYAEVDARRRETASLMAWLCAQADRVMDG